MANLFDYLLWRNDVPLSVDPFGEADNLLLSELAYTDFGSIVPEDGESVALPDVCAAFFASHDREAILQDSRYTAKAPLLMESMVTGARFGGMRLCRYINRVEPEIDAQIAAVTCLLDDGTAFIAFRGTDGQRILPNCWSVICIRAGHHPGKDSSARRKWRRFAPTGRSVPMDTGDSAG